MFFVQTNSTGVDYLYEIRADPELHEIHRIEAEAAKDSQFARWTDTKENAATALIPEGGSSDLQHWYLDGDQLFGRKAGRNTMNSTSLERLF